MEVFTSALLQSLSDEQSRKFQGLLPELVKRLIIESVDSVNYIRIPSEDAIWASGFDGIIETGKPSQYVAEGKSVWEFGTNKDPLSKINSDYKKRTNEPLGVNPKETAFYLVVPKIWAFDKGNSKQTITKWEAEKNEKKEWKCVHVYDAAILCDWINSCPVVAAWLAEKILESKNLEFKTVLGAWNSFAKYTNPELSHELFLTGRDNEKKDFIEYLSLKNVIKVKSYAMMDAFGFCLSSIMTDEHLANSIIVVYNEYTYKELCKIVKGKIFLIFNSSVEIFDGNNKTIILYNNENSETNEDVLLSLLKKTNFLNGLKSMGIGESKLSELYYHTQGHLLALINKIPNLYNYPKPSWYNDADRCLLIPLLFLKKIDASKDSYRKICELLLLQNNYNGLIQAYNRFSKMEDAPVKRIDSIYSIINSEIVWKSLNLDGNGPELEQLYHTIIHIIEICNKAEKNDLSDLDLHNMIRASKQRF